MDEYRFDYVYSNWIFTWFVLYYAGFVRVPPTLALYVGLVANTYDFISTQKGKTTAWKAFYIVRNILIKIIPVAILYFTESRFVWKTQLKTTLFLYALFLVWVTLNLWFHSKKPNPVNPFNFNSKDESTVEAKPFIVVENRRTTA